jgi:hypothetical protein
MFSPPGVLTESNLNAFLTYAGNLMGWRSSPRSEGVVSLDAIEGSECAIEKT